MTDGVEMETTTAGGLQQGVKRYVYAAATSIYVLLTKLTCFHTL